MNRRSNFESHSITACVARRSLLNQNVDSMCLALHGQASFRYNSFLHTRVLTWPCCISYRLVPALSCLQANQLNLTKKLVCHPFLGVCFSWEVSTFLFPDSSSYLAVYGTLFSYAMSTLFIHTHYYSCSYAQRAYL